MALSQIVAYHPSYTKTVENIPQNVDKDPLEYLIQDASTYCHVHGASAMSEFKM